ncbi:hypothetical protein D3C80_987820 [compost metagenome]
MKLCNGLKDYLSARRGHLCGYPVFIYLQKSAKRLKLKTKHFFVYMLIFNIKKSFSTQRNFISP